MPEQILVASLCVALWRRLLLFPWHKGSSGTNASLQNSIFCPINFARSVIPALIDDGVIFNTRKLLSRTVHESDRTQVPWQWKLKSNRCSTEHTEALEKFLQDTRCGESHHEPARSASEEQSAQQGCACVSFSKHKFAAQAVQDCYAEENERLFNYTFKLWMCRTAKRLKTPKPLELLRVWQHQSREKRIWLRAAVAQALFRDSHDTRLPEAGHICP